MSTDEDEIDRKPVVAFFNVAHSYCVAAMAVDNSDINCTHKDLPAYFLALHAIELYLKSYLLLKGMSVDQLSKKKYGHNIAKLESAAREHGLHLRSDYVNVIQFAQEKENAIKSRYISLGSGKRIRLRALVACCYQLHYNIVDSVYEIRPGISRRPELPDFCNSELEELKLPRIF